MNRWLHRSCFLSYLLLLISMIILYRNMPLSWKMMDILGSILGFALLIIGCMTWQNISLIIWPTLCLLAIQHLFYPTLSSQIWFSLFWLMGFLSLITYILPRSAFSHTAAKAALIATLVCFWIGFMTRWQESYADAIPHLPVSTLYEVLLLLSSTILTLYWYIETTIHTKDLGRYAIGLCCLINIFTIWYAYTHQAYLIRPLVPALQSYWMTLHVPMNFLGYGLFALAAMSSLGYLTLHPVHSSKQRTYLLVTVSQCIRWGLIFFSIATLLGSLWAADSWGSYWQWDPKETWALIVWMNYAAWLHANRIHMSERVRIWWAFISFFLTLFAFLGVNIFLSGLHSYGHL